MRKLLVISEPFLQKENNGTRNNALNTIIQAYTNYFDKVVCVVPTNNDTEESFTANKVQFYSVKGYKKTLKARVFFFLNRKRIESKINRIIEEEKPSIIQLRIPSVFVQLLTPFIKKKGIPIVTYIAGEWDEALKLNYDKFPFIDFFADRLFKSQYRVIKDTIPICTGDRLKSRFIDKNPLTYAYYSTTHNNVYKREIKKKYFNLLSIGRLEKLKRVEDTIKALYFLNKEDNNYRLSILGDGIDKERLVALVKELKLENKVCFYGHINDKEKVKEIFMNNDILIHSSLSEGTTKVLPEAMSFGLLPIAVQNVGSNDYILSQGRGFLVKPKSPKEISSKIHFFNKLSKEEKKLKIEAGYSYALEHTIDKELDKMWKYVDNIRV